MPTEHEATTPILPDQTPWRITYTEIGILAQVQRPVVTTWARRYPDFPAPVEHDGTRPLFDGHAVVRWLLDTGRGNADARHLRGELALHTLAAWSERLPGAALVDTLTSLICLRRHDDLPLAADGWPELVERARYFDEEDAFLAREIEAAAQAGEQLDGLRAVADVLVETAYSPAEPFTWILDARRRLGAHHLAEDSVTPAMAQCIARLSGIEEMEDGRVIGIPYVRTGDLLTALHDKDVTDTGHLYQACDPDPSLVRLVRRRALVHDIAEYELDIIEGDELPTEAFDAPDLITAVLPYEAGEDRDPLVALERIETLTDLLADGRMAVVLGPADALAQALPPRGEADRLRRSLLTSGLVKAVVNLPGGVMPYRPAYRTALWVLHRTPQEQRRGRVLLIDLSAQDLTHRTLDALCEDVHIWRTANWDDDGRHEPRHGVILPIQVLDDRPGIAFTPQHRSHASRYTSAVIDRPALISELEVRLSRLTDAAHRQHDQRPELRTRAALRPSDRPIRRTTVTRLLKERRLRKLPGHRIDAEHLRPEGRYDVLTPAEITGTAPVGTHRIDRAVLMTAYGHAQFTEPGDVVITVTPRFGVYVDEEGLSVVAYPARVLRVRPGAERPLRPRVLAALLRAAAAEHRRASGAVRAARRIEDMAIPDLDPDEASRCDALLVEIARRAALLREQAAALEDLSRLTAAGLTDGTLTILAPDFPSHAL
ncbi:N-6 DNA methylase [Streptomyces prunicolor]|uniref:N-6 DNA methylase n=1 Tax=Streptomyces prunicolor TaxID=67348 RepID=UPI00341AE41F